jgi:hypothetical protein
MPGVLACLKWYLRGDRHALRRLVQIARSGLAGFRAGRHARALARQSHTKLKLDCSRGH